MSRQPHILILSAVRLGIIDKSEFDNRLENLLASLAKLPLFEGKLPNKAYDTRTLAMTDYKNKASKKGIGGWSMGWSISMTLNPGGILAAMKRMESPTPQSPPTPMVSCWRLFTSNYLARSHHSNRSRLVIH